VVAGGLVAGTLDIVYACLFWALKRDVPAQQILQSVAAGLLGKASFEGGAATAALGLALHFLIALSMSAVYYLVSRRGRGSGSGLFSAGPVTACCSTRS
jgi:predicted ABC-type sugar transport system permease subunit